MTASVTVLFLFGAITCAAGAVLLSMHRFVLWLRTTQASTAGAMAAPVRLRRLPDRTEHKGRSGFLAQFDRWFLQLIRDSGTSWDPVSATLLLMLSGMLVAAVFLLWQDQVMLALLGMLMGMLLPIAYLIRQSRKRIRLLQEQLPPSLDMLARCVRAGQSLDQALATVGQQAPEPLATEFRMCAQQLDLGLAMSSVMTLLVKRVRLYDMRIFTTTLSVHRQTGGNVARVLERLASVIRDRLSYRRQLRVATGAGKASAILVGVIGPLVFVFFFVFRPDYLNVMLNSPLGQTVLMIAVFLEIVGLVWTARLLKPTY